MRSGFYACMPAQAPLRVRRPRRPRKRLMLTLTQLAGLPWGVREPSSSAASTSGSQVMLTSQRASDVTAHGMVCI